MSEEMQTMQNRGDAYLAKLNSQDVPPWAKTISLILTGLIGFILALGLNVGDVVTNYMTNQNTLQSTTLNQTGQIETNALTGLIDANKGMTSHITELISNINDLIDENTILVNSNTVLTQENADLKIQLAAKDEQITKQTQEIQDLKTRMELNNK